MSSYSDSWNLKYIELAKKFASWSKDPSVKVGAVAIGSKGQVLSQGYNGFPKQFNDSLDIYKTSELKKKYIIHAEMNCIYHATLNGISLEGSTLFVYGLEVCHECAKGIIQVGIKEVVTYSPNPPKHKWLESFKTSEELLAKSNINYIKLHKNKF
jgi:dCMP deaminase